MRFGSCFAIFLLPFVLGAQSGVITTIAGTGTRGFSDKDIALANVQNGCDPNRFEQTSHIAVDKNGVVYFADSNNQRIRRIEPNGTITTIAGDGVATPPNCGLFAAVNDGPNALAAHLYNPADILILSDGTLIIADQQNNRIRQIANGAIKTIAGSGMHNLFAPSVIATSSPMDWPSALALDPNGNIVFAEIHSNRIGRINPDGRLAVVAPPVSVLPSPSILNKPAGIAIDRDGNVFIADTGNHRIRKAAPDGSLTTIAGTGIAGFCGDNGPSAAACFNTPMDVKLDSRGNVYVADTLNHRIRRIDTSGIITTVAGDGSQGRGADNIPATDSRLDSPSAIALDSNDDLYIVDWQNYLIRKVSFPSIAAVVDGASFSAPPAPGGIFTIFGANLGSTTAVEVNGKPVPIYFVSANQINAQLPYEAQPGAATVTAAGTSAAFTIVAAAPAIFVAVRQDTVAVAYVTGLGAVTPPVPTGAAASRDVLSYANATVTATIGGLPAQVQFAGLAPSYIGLGQVNVLIPGGVTDLTLILEINGQKSKPATIR